MRNRQPPTAPLPEHACCCFVHGLLMTQNSRSPASSSSIAILLSAHCSVLTQTNVTDELSGLPVRVIRATYYTPPACPTVRTYIHTYIPNLAQVWSLSDLPASTYIHRACQKGALNSTPRRVASQQQSRTRTSPQIYNQERR